MHLSLSFLWVWLVAAPAPAELQDRLEVSTATCSPGGIADVFVLATHEKPLDGLELSLSVDEGLEILSVDQEGCPAICQPALFQVSPGEGCVSVGILIDLSREARAIPPGARQRVAHLRVKLPQGVAPGAEFFLGPRDGCGRVKNLFAVQESPGTVAKSFPTLAGGSVRAGEGEVPAAPAALIVPWSWCAGVPLTVSLEAGTEATLLEVEVYREEIGCSNLFASFEQPFSHSFEVSLAEPGAYRLRARAGSPCGWSQWTAGDPLQVVRGGTPAPPPPPEVASVGCRGKDIHLALPGAAGADRFQVQVRGGVDWEDLTLGQGAPPSSVFLPETAGVYTFRSRAGNLCGWSGWSDESSFEVQVCFRRGEVDGNGGLDLTDAIVVLSFLFLGGPAPNCPDAADANDDGQIDISDPVFLLGYLFLGTRPPPPPGPTVEGPDPELDDLPDCKN